MTAPVRWKPPAFGPGNSGVLPDGSLRVPDFHTGMLRRCPVPLLQREVEPWLKPSGTTAFPLHTSGTLEMFSRTWQQVKASEVLTALSDPEKRWLQRECWRITGLVFVPGASIRAALDAARESAELWPKFNGSKLVPNAMRAEQLSFLAAWAVFAAACEWAAL